MIVQVTTHTKINAGKPFVKILTGVNSATSGDWLSVRRINIRESGYVPKRAATPIITPGQCSIPLTPFIRPIIIAKNTFIQ
jgi:hypothetical protein